MATVSVIVLNEGLEHLHIEFVQQGRLMHPFFRFHLEKKVDENIVNYLREMGEEPDLDAYTSEEAVSVPARGCLTSLGIGE